MADYRTLGLLKLLRRIAEQGDRAALSEFHSHRTIFDVGTGSALLFGDYVNYLRERTAETQSWKHIRPEAVKTAYDNAIERFLNVPRSEKCAKRNKSKSLDKPRRRGPDCRRYFRGFISSLERGGQGLPMLSNAEMEMRVARLMQNYVKKHFYLCLKDSVRSGSSSTSRYDWRVGGRSIRLWFPTHIRGRKRREWLEQHVSDPDPVRPNERERIQAMINHLLMPAQEVSYSDRENIIAGAAWVSVQPEEGGLEESPRPSLVEHVANEKVCTIDLQPPSIRVLGRRKLKVLVRAVLNNISDPTAVRLFYDKTAVSQSVTNN